jgi:leucyl aminopeptidase (aminopeptidase T)
LGKGNLIEVSYPPRVAWFLTLEKSDNNTARKKNMTRLYEFELGKAARILVEELFGLKPGETMVITADTESNEQVVNATAQAVFAAGGKPVVLWLASPLGVGKAADSMLPEAVLVAALRSADAWVEYNNQWIFYSTAYDKVYKDDCALRHLCLVGMNPDMMVRCIGRINHPALKAFQDRLADLIKSSHHVRIASDAGTDIEFDNYPGRNVLCRDGYALTPGSHMMSGQMSWAPALETLNGTIVFDGSINPPTGLLDAPVCLTVKAGVVTKVEGSRQAQAFDAWLRGFNHPQMLRIAHSSLGFNPGARLTGDVAEDERIWGATEWGIGNIGKQLIPNGVPGPSHCDGICLNTSIWFDGVRFTKDGQLCLEEFIALEKVIRQ